MEASILIVSKNRKEELRKTIEIVLACLDLQKHELLIFLDGCSDGSESLEDDYPDINWTISERCLGASKARSKLYSLAKGDLLFGFDDDAHPLRSDFIEKSKELFLKNPNLGIISFHEIKGKFENDIVPPNLQATSEDILVKDFLGCGFCIKKKVYNATRGFPVWIDIYGEEVCVALETLDLGYEILYTHQITINHRVDLAARKLQGANYFRFGKQLKNTAYFYLVYYPFPLLLKKIGRLFLLNFKKYGLKDVQYFKKFLEAMLLFLFSILSILKYRKPVDKGTIVKFNNLSNPKY